MRESEFYQWLRRQTPSLEWDRIENALTSGMFDATVMHPSQMLWVELKIQRHSNVLLDLRPVQIAWAYRKLRQGLGSRLAVLSTKEDSSFINLWFLHLSEHPETSRNGVVATLGCGINKASAKHYLTPALIEFPQNYPYSSLPVKAG